VCVSIGIGWKPRVGNGEQLNAQNYLDNPQSGIYVHTMPQFGKRPEDLIAKCDRIS
jgi:hypothetical protein